MRLARAVPVLRVADVARSIEWYVALFGFDPDPFPKNPPYGFAMLRRDDAEIMLQALVDAPSDHAGEDGLAGFRTSSDHAADLGAVIADVRARTKSLIWLAGTSRGTISAANAASRLAGPSAPDGLVLTSVLMSGATSGRKPWVTQTVFDLPLEKIRVPVLVVGHAADTCVRSPAALMSKITARTNGAREQVVTVTGGPGIPRAGVDACEGRSPHGFVDQEAEVAFGIARFVRGGSY